MGRPVRQSISDQCLYILGWVPRSNLRVAPALVFFIRKGSIQRLPHSESLVFKQKNKNIENSCTRTFRFLTFITVTQLLVAFTEPSLSFY